MFLRYMSAECSLGNESQMVNLIVILAIVMGTRPTYVAGIDSQPCGPMQLGSPQLKFWSHASPYH